MTEVTHVRVPRLWDTHCKYLLSQPPSSQNYVQSNLGLITCYCPRECEEFYWPLNLSKRTWLGVAVRIPGLMSGKGSAQRQHSIDSTWHCCCYYYYQHMFQWSKSHGLNRFVDRWSRMWDLWLHTPVAPAGGPQSAETHVLTDGGLFSFLPSYKKQNAYRGRRAFSKSPNDFLLKTGTVFCGLFLPPLTKFCPLLALHSKAAREPSSRNWEAVVHLSPGVLS